MALASCNMALQLRPQSISKFISNLSTMQNRELVHLPPSTLPTTNNRIQDISSNISISTPKTSLKRRRKSESPISISSTPPRRSRGSSGSRSRTKCERDKFFDAIEAEDAYPMSAISIKCADDLTEAQLKKCFEILHACGSATDSNASLKTTRQSIDGFLDAVFNEWSSRRPGDLLRAELDFLVEAEVVVGRVCEAVPHSSIEDCKASETCTSDITAVATYSNNPPMFKLEFCTIDQFTGEPEPVCTISRSHSIKWAAPTTNWIQDLRGTLRSKIINKIHKYNKHLAVWQARKLVVEWSKGSLSMGEDMKDMGFLGREAVNGALLGLGSCDNEE